ncbi:hypothetical protein [Prosthecomicrobium sp. N25]|uniref:hypothetical protein n=1 Tax=Prosthecomicrobium sp. N25 TaxID=3129254 RepID=UPI003077B31B
MRHAILHVGLHKTGTSAIQRALSEARDALAAQGISYPGPAGRRPLPRAHHALSQDLGLPVEPEPDRFGLAELDAVLAEDGADTLVLSSETLSGPLVTAERVRPLVDRLLRHGFAVTAVAFVRPQAALATSFYVEQVKALQCDLDFEAYAAELVAHDEMDLGRRLQAWTDSPEIRFVAVPYRPARDGLNPAEDLLAAAGVDEARIRAVGLGAGERVNVSFGPEGVAACRLLARRAASLLPGARRALAQIALDEVQIRGWDAGRFDGFDDDGARRFGERFAASNEAFAARHWGSGFDARFGQEAGRRWHRNERSPETLGDAGEAFVDAVLRRFEADDLRPKIVRLRRQAERQARRGPFRRLFDAVRGR